MGGGGQGAPKIVFPKLNIQPISDYFDLFLVLGSVTIFVQYSLVGSHTPTPIFDFSFSMGKSVVPPPPKKKKYIYIYILYKLLFWESFIFVNFVSQNLAKISTSIYVYL